MKFNMQSTISRIRLASAVVLTLALYTATGSAQACAAVAPLSVQVPAAGGGVTVAVSAPANCSWTLVNFPSWIAPASPVSGTGSAMFSFQVAPARRQRRAAIYIYSPSAQRSSALAAEYTAHFVVSQ